MIQRLKGMETVASRLTQFGEGARGRIQADFERAGVAYPPEYVTLVAIKAQRRLRVFAGTREGTLQPIKDYPVLGQSGQLGPKLREGDHQVPEGLYEIEGLNPNSRFYVSLRLNYPNAWDLARAGEEERHAPGSDIYIHGQTASVGCLAMGDPAIEELFTLVADVGRTVPVIIAPVDFLAGEQAAPEPDSPPWLPRLYQDIDTALRAL